MEKRRVMFDEFIVPSLKGYKQIVDFDEKTKYLFIKAPKDSYTLYFDSGMPIYDEGILSDSKETGVMEFKFDDRKILLYCPTRIGQKNGGLWFFNIQFEKKKNELLVLPGQIILNSFQDLPRLLNGRYSFLDVLEQIQIKNN